MKTPLVIAAIGICHRDLELGALWLRWVSFLCSQEGGNNGENVLLVMLTQRVTAAQREMIEGCIADNSAGMFKTYVVTCWDEDESGYPKSASHLFLRTLECAEQRWPGAAVFWCEPDTVAMKPTWFAEIAAEYALCGKPNLGMLVGTQFPHQSGNSIYAGNWRTLMPSIARVLEAPDYALWGPGKGQPWDVFCRDETTPNMAESRLMHQVWKDRDLRPTSLEQIPPQTCLFHQDKAGHLIREIASARYAEFLKTLNGDRKFYYLQGHPSRLLHKGFKIRWSWSKYTNHSWKAAVCSDEMGAEEALVMPHVVGRFGVIEISEEVFLQLTGRTVDSLPITVRPLARSDGARVDRPSIFVMLGRYGDICNILPLLWRENEEGRRPTLVVGKDFADILDGVSYVDRIVWDGDYDRLPDCLRWLKRERGIANPVILQFHRHPTDKARMTSSYQTECWRLGGRLDQFGKDPLIFDRRDSLRESAVKVAFRSPSGAPIILVALRSVSSPFNSGGYLEQIKKSFKDCLVVNLDEVRVDRIFDLIALYESAACLVAVDTVHLHLSRGSKVPTIALINEGWRGSVPLGNLVATLRYSEATPQKVCEWLQAPILDAGLKEDPPLGSLLGDRRVIHVVDGHGDSPRHRRARKTWPQAIRVTAQQPYDGRSGRTIGDRRDLPRLRHLLELALAQAKRDDDVIIWGNSDVGFEPGAFERFADHAIRHGAFSMRRKESNGAPHMGREVFGFRAGWLRVMLPDIPDFFVGAPAFDLVLAAIIRRNHDGADADRPIVTTLENLSEDIAPAEMPPGLATHESHRSSWSGKEEFTLPCNVHNQKLAREWCAAHCPTLKL